LGPEDSEYGQAELYEKWRDAHPITCSF